MLLIQYDAGGVDNIDKGYYIVRIMNTEIYWESKRYKSKRILLDAWLNDKLQIRRRYVANITEIKRDAILAEGKTTTFLLKKQTGE